MAIEQRTSRGGRKSTVATLTEIYHFLRLLFVKLGTQHCPDCEIGRSSPQTATPSWRGSCSSLSGSPGRTVLAPLVVARKGYYTDLAKWAAGKGFEDLRVDGPSVLPTDPWPRLDRFKEHDIELPVGEAAPSPRSREAALRELLDRALDSARAWCKVVAAGSERKGRGASGPETDLLHDACVSRLRPQLPELDPRLFSFNSKHGWCEALLRHGP